MNRRARGVWARRGGHSQGQFGAAAVEFALVLPIFLLLVFGLIQYGLYFYAAQAGSHVANSAVRQLSVGNCQVQSELEAYVDDSLGAAAESVATVAVEYKDPDGSVPTAPQGANVKVGGNVRLTLTFKSLNMHFPLLPFLSDATVERTVDARVEDIADDGCGA